MSNGSGELFTKLRLYLSPASAERADNEATPGITLFPHSTVKPAAVVSPQRTVSPHSTDVSWFKSRLNRAACENTTLPQTNESPQSTDEPQVPIPRRMSVFPVAGFRTAVGDRAGIVAKSLFVSAAAIFK